MGIFKLIQTWWYARCRRMDLDILWPECCKAAPNLLMAKGMFTYHAIQDPAWCALGEEEMRRIINNLEPTK